MTRRSGLTTIAFVMILLVAIAIAGTSIFLARSANRSTTWFVQAQRSQDLASTAMKVVLAHLAVSGVEPPADATDPFSRLLGEMRGEPPKGTVYDLLGPRETHPWASELTRQLEAWGRDPPNVTVRGRVFERRALWAANLLGVLPPDPAEACGVLQLTASAHTSSRDGMSVGRTLVLERDFRVVSLCPPLLGGFTLFSPSAPAASPNFIPVEVQDGDGVLPAAAQRPLVLVSGQGAGLVSGRKQDERTLQPRLATLLDEHGWIYLGNAGSAEPWLLKLAHGFGHEGETPLLPGHVEQRDGQVALFRGHAAGAEQIGAAAFPGAALAAATPAESERSSCLRLFGTPDEFTPTLVFGPVSRGHVKRDFPDPAGSGPAPESAQADPFIYGLDQALYPSAGEYQADGVLPPPADAPAPRLPARSRIKVVQDWLDGNAAATAGRSAAPGRPESVYRGELDLPDFYAGSLASGLQAFKLAMERKAAYRMTCDQAKAFFARKAAIPGILQVERMPVSEARDGFPLRNLEVTRGGILVFEGGVNILSDVRRDARQPLTIVCLTGDIRIDPGARRVDAGLVALEGSVLWPGQCEIHGMVAAKTLDLESIRTHPAQRKIVYDPVLDPRTRSRQSLRVLFGGSDKLAVLGGED